MVDKYIGKRLDKRYEIKELLGIGGMALVYSAFDILEKRLVAIKILKDEFLNNKDFMRRFKNESKTIAMLSHPNIVKVLDVSLGDKIQYIVMEYVDGITLKDFIERQKRVKWKDAVFFTSQILGALSHAHEKGIVHRDIKPQNIMLLKDGTIKVTDFGIAKSLSYETRTLTDKAIGSVHYISPEQARGDITNKTADIYSVGVLLYELLTGTLPFVADNAVSVAIMQLQSNPRPLREINLDIPEGLQEITLKAMQKNPEFRYKTAKEMLAAINEFKKNPSIKFEYKYFSNDEPTKYIDVINSIKAAKKNENFNDSDLEGNLLEKNKKSKTLSIAVGVGIAVIVAAAILALGLITGWFGLTAKDVEVPNFIGQQINSVVDNSSYKFKWNVKYSYDSLKPEGIIIDQDPKVGTKKIKENSEVTLIVNSPGASIQVPSLKGKAEESAKSILKDAGFLYEVLYAEDEETAKGIVIGTDPEAGKEVTAGSTVKLFVSKGAKNKTVTVPNVEGKSLPDASAELLNKGLKVSDEIIKEKSSKVKDTVISISPLPGTEVKEGSSVKLTVSSGELPQKNISIYVDLPASVTREVSFKVYINGILDSANSKKLIPSYIGTYTLTVSGTSGKKTVAINLDDSLYRTYEIDFDGKNVVKTSSKAFSATATVAKIKRH